jgi:hypothetical protein
MVYHIPVGGIKLPASYKFIEATSVASLQDSVNKFVGENQDYTVINITFAAGTGFVATLEKRGRPIADSKAA